MVKSHFPETYQQALWVLSAEHPMIIAGGTDLMVKRRKWSGLAPGFSRDVIFISQLAELDYIIRSDKKVRVGAAVTLERLLHSHDIPELLKKALRLMASPGIRHTATLAGNIGNASPAGDSLPVLYVLNAKIILGSISGERTVPIEDFITGPGSTSMNPDEMIKEILFDNSAFDFMMYEKIGGRKSDAISKISFAGAISSVFGMVSDIRIAFGSVAPVVVRIRELENRWKQMPVDEVIRLEDIVIEQYDPHIKPIDDQRSNAAYRKKCARNLIKKFLEDAGKSYK